MPLRYNEPHCIMDPHSAAAAATRNVTRAFDGAGPIWCFNIWIIVYLFQQADGVRLEEGDDKVNNSKKMYYKPRTKA